MSITRLLAVRLALTVALAPIAACGTDAGEVERFIADLANETCSWQFRCCTDVEIRTSDGRKYTNQAECVPFKQLELQKQLFLDRLAARENRIRVDRAKADACVAQMAERACNPKPGMTVPPVDPMAMDACKDVLVGSTAPGDACIAARECRKGSRCVGDSTTVGRGVCVPYQQDGDICNGDADCDPDVKNLYCAQKDFHCHLLGQFGQRCEYTMEGGTARLPLLLGCDASAGLYCDPIANLCARLPGDGEHCLSPLPPGVTSSCDPNPALKLVCETTTTGTVGYCRAPGQVGDDCTSRLCATNLTCNRTRAPYVCVEAADFGEACTSIGCRTPYFCNYNLAPAKCDQPASINESCVSMPCGTDLYCDPVSDVCKYRLEDGQPCSSSSECLSLNCGYDAQSQRVCLPGTVGVACVGR